MSDMRIVFQDNQLCLRGTSVAVYDYAYYCRELLGVDSYVIYQQNAKDNNEKVIKKFKETFDESHVIAYSNLYDMNRIVDSLNADIFYAIKSGRRDGVVSRSAKNCIHSVFQSNDPHGNVYAYVSEWLAARMGRPGAYVPHIVNLPKVTSDLREQLKIPKDAFVIGRHGGYDSFDIHFVKSAIVEALSKRSDLYFVFVNTERFYNHERIIYIDNVANLEKKALFINTCDAMIHARRQGESFGLSIAEFSFMNKPVILCRGGIDLNHVHMMRDVGLFYTNQREVLDIFLNIQKNKDKNYDVVSTLFSPKNVIEQFDKIFIKG